MCWRAISMPSGVSSACVATRPHAPSPRCCQVLDGILAFGPGGAVIRARRAIAIEVHEFRNISEHKVKGSEHDEWHMAKASVLIKNKGVHEIEQGSLSAANDGQLQ